MKSITRSRHHKLLATGIALAAATGLAFVPASAFATTGPLAPETPTAKSGPTTIAYVEVNNEELANVGRYTLEGGSNAFDVAVIFAANINYDGAKLLVNNVDVMAMANGGPAKAPPASRPGGPSTAPVAPSAPR